jgi:hypothetical protein
VAITFGINPRCAWGFPPVSGLDAARGPVCTTLQQLPPRLRQALKNAVPNNRRLRAHSVLVLYWWTSPGADETARVMRDLSRQKHSREIESLDETSRFVCNTVLGLVRLVVRKVSKVMRVKPFPRKHPSILLMVFGWCSLELLQRCVNYKVTRSGVAGGVPRL